MSFVILKINQVKYNFNLSIPIFWMAIKVCTRKRDGREENAEKVELHFFYEISSQILLSSI